MKKPRDLHRGVYESCNPNSEMIAWNEIPWRSLGNYCLNVRLLCRLAQSITNGHHHRRHHRHRHEDRGRRQDALELH